MPVIYLIMWSLQKLHYYCGNNLKIDRPPNWFGHKMTLDQVAMGLSERPIRMFPRDREGRWPVHVGSTHSQWGRNRPDLALFYQHLHGDNGAGLGASHQTDMR